MEAQKAHARNGTLVCSQLQNCASQPQQKKTPG